MESTVIQRTTAGNPVKKILLKLNLSDHRILKDGGEDFRYSNTVRLSRSDKVLKLKNFKKDATLKLSKSTNQEREEHEDPKVTSHNMQHFQDGERNYAWTMITKLLKITMSNTSSRNKLYPEINDHYNIFTRESQEYKLKTKDES
ncbi:hypothetical protein Tco_1569872 [Tanacetum coccineum]